MIQYFSTTASKISLAVAFTALAFVISPSVDGDEFDRIDNMAKKIQKKSRLLIKETVHYRHTPQYASLVDATTHLYDAASHIHEVAHFANNLDHLQSDLADLDRHFHQLEGLFQATQDSVSRGRGEVHGNTGYAKGLMRSIEVSIDSMRRDVRKAQSKVVSRQKKAHQSLLTATPRNSNYSNYGNHDIRVRSEARGYAPAVVKPRPVQPNNLQPRVIVQPRVVASPRVVAQPRVVNPVVVQRSVPQYRPVYPQQRRASGFSLSIGGGSSGLSFNF